jgi:hypothetical protein
MPVTPLAPGCLAGRRDLAGERRYASIWKKDDASKVGFTLLITRLPRSVFGKIETVQRVPKM